MPGAGGEAWHTGASGSTIDGSFAAETSLFALAGQTYEIDLSTANATKLRGALAPYVEKGRRAVRIPIPRRGGNPHARPGGSLGRTREEITAIRAWALANGYNVAQRGRIKWGIIDAYHQAHS